MGIRDYPPARNRRHDWCMDRRGQLLQPFGAIKCALSGEDGNFASGM